MNSQWLLLKISLESENVAHSVISDSLRPPWTVTCQASLSMEFSRQECWSGLLLPFPEDLPNPGIKPGSPALQADFFTLLCILLLPEKEHGFKSQFHSGHISVGCWFSLF